MVTLVAFFAAGQQPEMSPEEYLRRNLGSGGNSLPWLLPLLYVLMALSLVAWAGMRYSNRSRRGRALFVFTIGIVLIVLASAFFFVRAVGTSSSGGTWGPVGVGAAATLLGCAMLVVAAGSLLPSVEDWFGARRELRIIEPILDELGRRQPHVGIGVRPRGPLVFRVAERMSLISDALYLEATAADPSRKLVDTTGALPDRDDEDTDDPELDAPTVPPKEQAGAIAKWIYAGREDAPRDIAGDLPGAGLAAPTGLVCRPRMDPCDRRTVSRAHTQRRLERLIKSRSHRDSWLSRNSPDAAPRRSAG